MTRIYFVRHCEALGNVTKRYHGVFDSQITDRGRRQLEALAQRFADTPLDAVYTSPLQRARLTAEAINRSHSLPLHIEPRLMEQDGGGWEDLSWEDIFNDPENRMDSWANDPEKFCPPGGENFSQVLERVCAAVADIVQRHAGQPVAAATHAGVLRVYMAHLTGVGIAGINGVGWAENTAVYAVDYEDGKTKIILENDTAHLSDALIERGRLI